LEKNVCFCGVRNDVERIFSISEFTVLPSLTEGMPLALLESLAVGKPAIVSNVGGIPEVIEDGEQGILVSPGDENALATAMNILLSDVQRTQAMGANAASRSRAFDVKKGVAETIDLYQRIING
jgi:glycosyltransferase involved in cell wall biosynthesis